MDARPQTQARIQEPERKGEAEPQPVPLRPEPALLRPEAAPAQKNARRPFLILGGILAAVLLAIGTYVLVTYGEESTDDAEVEADVVPVAARVAALVVRVPIVENQQVKKGDLLVELDPTEFAARVKQAEAELETARAQAEAADAQVEVVEATARGGLLSAQASVYGSSAGVSNASAMIAGAQAALSRAQADERRAQLDLERDRRLMAGGAVSQQALDNAQLAYDTAQAQVEQARAQLAAAQDTKRVAESRVNEARGRLGQSEPIKAQITTAHANADLAHARVKSAEAQLLLARLQLSYTRITAPTDGEASKLAVHEGQLTQVGQTVLELVPSTTYVVANFKETQVGKMHPGQPADIEIDAFPHRTLHGKVESLSGGTGASFSLLPPDNASGNFVKVVQRVPVRIAWAPAPGDIKLRAGLSATVTVHVNR